MILRALFWIAVVAVFMPREPDLGLGRPSPVPGAVVSVLPPAVAGSVESLLGAPHQACRDNAQGCAAALGVIDDLQSIAIRSLSQVKAEIEQSERDRARRAAEG